MILESVAEQANFIELLENLKAEAHIQDPLERMRDKGWQQFLSLGLPSRQTENYRTIKLRHLFSQSYQLAQENTIATESIDGAVYPECRHSLIVLVNGNYSPELSNISALPPKVVISSIQEAMPIYGTLLNNYWAKSLKGESDPFAALNFAMQSRGIFIYVPPKCECHVPIQLLHVVAAENQSMILPRAQIFLGALANIHLIHSQICLTTSPYFINQVTDSILEEGAQLQYSQILCEESPQSWHFDAFRANLKRDSKLETVAVTEGAGTIRHDYRIQLTGENSEVLLNGVNMLCGKKEAHTNISIDHQSPHCRSYQLFKNVLNDFSRSSFEGKILVQQAAQKTEAFQLNNNLILNDHAQADSKPNLEIFADDVKASHGATVGQLDPDQLFYMKTRGLSDAAAKNLLIYGFCEQVIEKIPLASAREMITERVKGLMIA